MVKRTLTNYVLIASLGAVGFTNISSRAAEAVTPSADPAYTDSNPEPQMPLLSAANAAAVRSPSNSASPNNPNASLVPPNQAFQQSVLDSDLQNQSPDTYPEASPMAINRWHIDFQIAIGALYDDNIYVAHTNRVGDFTLSISPLVIVTLGDYENHLDNYLSVAYQPTYLYYPDHSGLNAWENQVLVDGQYVMNRLTLSGQFRFDSKTGQSLTTINDESVGRVDRNIYDALLRAEYALTGKISVETELEWLYHDYKNRIDSTDYTARVFLNYQVAPKIKIGPGFAIGYTDVQNGASQVYEQALVQAIYAATEKLSFDSRAGVEFRHFNSGASDKADPIFSLGATYHPFVDTTIDLNAYRRQRSSADQFGQNLISTGVSLLVSQKLFQRFTASIEGGYEHSKYNSAARNVSASRQDDFYYGRAGIAYDFRDWLTAEIYYLYRENDSNDTFRSFYENIGGIQMVFKF
jgi:hypothetical protein